MTIKKSFFVFVFFSLGTCLVTLQAQELINSQYLGHRTKNYLQNLYGPLMQNGINLYKINYETYDIHGELDTASGLMVVPVRDDAYNYPLLCYQHGTVNGPNDVPSNLSGGSQLPMIFGGMGYVTSAADYLGLGDARGFHPYLHAKTEASAAIDMLFAVRQLAEEDDELSLNDQLFIAGYSQGGHAAAAVHKEIEEFYPEDFTVTASAPMSGPYNLSETMIDFILDESVYYYPGYVAWTLLSLNLSADLGYEVEEIFKAPYADYIEQFYQAEITLSPLHSNLISQLTAIEGASIPKFMIQDSLIAIFENEEEHPIVDAFRDNDLYDWTPQAPTRLYYCTADDQVYYLNSVVADSVMNANGAADLMAIDVNSNADHGECVSPAMIQALLFFGGYQDISVGNEEISISTPMMLSPNPANDFININQLPEGTTIEIFDLDGRKRMDFTTSAARDKLDISHLTGGVYLFRAFKGAHQYHGKLIKN